MKFLRRISTRRLLALCAGVITAGIATAALALATTGGGPTPPPKPLPQAIHDALAAPPVQGISARIQFTNDLIASSSVQGSDPLLTGGSGRLWASPDGKLRLELQSDGGTGDSQVVIDGRRFLVYSGDTSTAYRGRVPGDAAKSHPSGHERIPSIARIRGDLTRLARHLAVGGGSPTDVAGRPAYTVRVSPKQHGGLIGGAELAWDALHGTPLRAALYARGNSSPVLELRVTDISFGPVSDSVFAITPPPGTKVTDVSPASGPAHGEHHAAVTGLPAVRKRIAFKVAAPRSVGRMARSGVRLIHSGESNGSNGALVTYGRGLDGVAVLELPSSQRQPNGQAAASGSSSELNLPSISIDGVSGTELETALGTVVHFKGGGVEYTVAGSVPPAVAEDAARGL
jgi:outer membrane lipoprotein-sorting protein